MSLYPEVEVVSSTGIKPTKEKLKKKMFAHHGIRKRICTYNCPPLNSKEFSAFEKDFDIIESHMNIPSQWPGERFMQKEHLQGKIGLDRNMAVHDMLMAYVDTAPCYWNYSISSNVKQTN